MFLNSNSPNLQVKTPLKKYTRKPQRTPIESPHLPAILKKSPSSPILNFECSPSICSMVKSFIDMPSPVSTCTNKAKKVIFPTKSSLETSEKNMKEIIKKKICC